MLSEKGFICEYLKLICLCSRWDQNRLKCMTLLWCSYRVLQLVKGREKFFFLNKSSCYIKMLLAASSFTILCRELKITKHTQHFLLPRILLKMKAKWRIFATICWLSIAIVLIRWKKCWHPKRTLTIYSTTIWGKLAVVFL